MRGDGYDKLWGWFGLSRASFCVMPRVLMHEMPDEWQAKMADLLEQYDATFDRSDFHDCKVMAVRDDGKFTRWPEWFLNYRRPDVDQVNSIRNKSAEDWAKILVKDGA